MSQLASIWQKANATLHDPYLRNFWYVALGGYLGIWFFSWFVASLGSSKAIPTVYRCRQSFAIMFVVHCIAALIVIFLWWRTFFPFIGFYGYLMTYASLILIDLVFIIKLMIGLRAYRTYGK